MPNQGNKLQVPGFSRKLLDFASWLKAIPSDSGLILVISLFSVFACAASKTVPEKTWWNKSWPYRRKIIIRAKQPGYAVVRFNTFMRSRPDGKDIFAVVDHKFLIKRTTILDCGRDDMVLVSFPVTAPGHDYYIYFGNQNDKRLDVMQRSMVKSLLTDYTMLPKAGLFLETRKLGKGDADNWNGMKRLLTESKTSFGIETRRSCSLGLNPFEESRDYLALWAGYIQLKESGKWIFATNSNGPSFVFIDGREIVSWPGWHTARGGERGVHQGSLSLQKGMHRFEYYFAAKGGRNGHLCGIQGPSAKVPHIIGTGEICPLLDASTGGLEEINSDDIVDFTWRNEGDMGLSQRNICMLFFSDRSEISKQKIVSWKWRFGDGQAGRGKNVRHLFLNSGLYTIELEMETAGGTVIRNNTRIRVYPKGKRNLSIKRAVSESLDYDFSRLTDVSLKNLLYLLWQDGRSDMKYFFKAARLYFLRKHPPSGEEDNLFAKALLDKLFLSGDPKVVLIARRFVQEAGNLDLKLEAAEIAGETLRYIQGKPDEAEKIWLKALDLAGNHGGERRKLLLLLLSDVYSEMGKKEKEKNYFDRARASKNTTELIRGEGVFQIKHYIEEKKFSRAWKSLNRWIVKDPGVISTGMASFYRAQILTALTHFRPALREMERALKLAKGPLSRTCLLNAISLAEKLNLKEKANAFEKKLETDFPEKRRK